ncbi:inner membrane protein YccF [Klebsiella pneumoniae]|uniref:Inner membrane protein YccF n=1 Tax=Klebsiella pneumoniae TaxID=573 RepID=A0A378CBA9_KLEPN|nr:inner membrane protein YccF [Klebsiella pneumoniae]
MRTILNILNFILGGFATTLGWLLATLVSIILIVTLPLTRSCWEITRLSLFPYGNEAIHVDELEPGRKNGLLNAGGTVLNILWFIFFRLVALPDAHFQRYSSVPDYHRHPGGDREFQNRRHRPLAGGSPGRFCGNRACCA